MKNQTGRLILSVLMILVILCLLCSCDVKSTIEKWVPFYPDYVFYDDAPTVAVSIADSEGVAIEGERLLRVPLGDALSLPMTVKEGYRILNLPDGYEYADGILKIAAVNYPTTIEIKTEKLSEFRFYAYSSDSGLGHIETNIAMGVQYGGTAVSVSAKPIGEGVKFLGFSLENSLADGGSLITTATEYSFTLSADTVVYANFKKPEPETPNEPEIPPEPEDEDRIPEPNVSVPANKWAILYNPNGGIDTKTGKGEIRTTYFSKAYYLCPNTLPNDGQFSREGYALLGYNTKADGSGTYYAPGWNIVMPDGYKAIELYCMWQKESDLSDFSYSMQGTSVIITGYKGNDSFIVVPETIQNRPVTSIGAKVFVGLDAESLYIPRQVKKMSVGSVNNCPNLTNLYLSDSITTMQDTAIGSCPKLQKLYIMATRYPAYSGQRNGTYAIKFERLITAKGRKLVLTGASNGAFGFNSPLLQELLAEEGYDFSVVNYCNNQATTALFYIEVISHFIREGDILLHAAEPVASQWGGLESFEPTLWQIFEGAYDAFSYVDIRHYEKVFSSFAAHNSARASLKSKENAYELYTTSENVNMYGDYSKLKVGTAPSFGSKVSQYLSRGAGDIDLAQGASFVRSGYRNLNPILDLVTEAGGEVLISFSSIMDVALTPGSQIAGGADQEAYRKAIDDVVHGTRISEQSTYVMDYRLFYNSEYHLNSEGAEIRTKNTAAEISKYLKGKAE